MRKGVIKIVCLACVAGIVCSGFLLAAHHRIFKSGFEEKSFCSINEWIDCDVVNASSYSEIFTIPVAGLGLVYYLVILFYSFLSLFLAPHQKGGLLFSFLFSIPALLFSFYMVFISYLKIKVLCLLCLAMIFSNGVIIFLLPLCVGSYAAFFSLMKNTFKAVFKKENRLDFNPHFLRNMGGVGLFLVVSIVIISKTMNVSADPQFKTRLDQYLRIHFGEPTATINTAGHPFWGPENAPVTVVEFSDFQCPYCRVAATNIKPALAEYRNQVKIYFINYPLDSSCNPKINRPMHPFACLAARASLCAAQKNQFWAYHDLIFKNQKNLSEEKFYEWAQKLGMDKNWFADCLQSEETKNRLEAGLGLAEPLQIRGTPSIFVNGRRLGPWNNIQVLRAVIKKEIENARSLHH